MLRTLLSVTRRASVVVFWQKIHVFCFPGRSYRQGSLVSSECSAKLPLLQQVFESLDEQLTDGLRYSAVDIGKTLSEIVNASKVSSVRDAARDCIAAFKQSPILRRWGSKPPKAISTHLAAWDDLCHLWARSTVCGPQFEPKTPSTSEEAPPSYDLLKIADVSVGDIIVSCEKNGKGRVWWPLIGRVQTVAAKSIGFLPYDISGDVFETLRDQEVKKLRNHPTSLPYLSMSPHRVVPAGKGRLGLSSVRFRRYHTSMRYIDGEEKGWVYPGSAGQ